MMQAWVQGLRKAWAQTVPIFPFDADHLHLLDQVLTLLPRKTRKNGHYLRIDTMAFGLVLRPSTP